MPISDNTALVSLLFTLKKARAVGRNVGIFCLIKVAKRESVLNMQQPTEKLPLQSRTFLFDLYILLACARLNPALYYSACLHDYNLIFILHDLTIEEPID